MSVNPPIPHAMDARGKLEKLAAAAGLPPVASTHQLGVHGFDNQLLAGILSDGRHVLLRQRYEPTTSPVSRAKFLAAHDVGAPRLYAADDTGAVLVEFIPGETLAAVANRGALDDHVWKMVGEAYARVHAVQFPAPLRGPFGPHRLELTPEDPVDLLHGKVDAGEAGVRAQRPAMLPLLDMFRARIDARADELRREVPCLAHADANFHNLIVNADRVTLIDWDYPGVRYPLEVLDSLETHAYLNGVSELPDSFVAGYGREISRPLLRIYRIASCLQGFNSTEWADLATDDRFPEALQSMIKNWDDRLREWIYGLEYLLDET